MDFIVLLSTMPNKREAKIIAKLLVEKKLAACVQIIGPIESVYLWDKKINEQKEYILMAKTRKSLFEEAKDLIHSNHSYELPEIVSFEIGKGDKKYLNWIKSSTMVISDK